MPNLERGSFAQAFESRRLPVWRDLRSFLTSLETRGDLVHVRSEVKEHQEVTAICRQALLRKGPALIFDQVKGHAHPVLGNLFGTPHRVARALRLESPASFREVGKLLAFFQSPHLPVDWRQGMQDVSRWMNLTFLRPRRVHQAPCQEIIAEHQAVDLDGLPIQVCWPEDAGPLLTFGLVVTRGTRYPRMNVAVYRQQKIAKNKLIMRWLAHRGGAQDYREWVLQNPDRPFPVAVVLGADPAMLLAAVAPIPDPLSEYQFAGLFRGARTELIRCRTHDLYVPAQAEIVLEGYIYPGETALEGPFCDHTGYYNATAQFPVLTVERICSRDSPLYHHSYMGRPTEDEPSILAEAFNEMFIPVLQNQFPEVEDFYLPPASCSYRVAVVSIRKQYPGHARRIMMGIWSWLRQFTYTKYIVVVDEDIDIRDTRQVLWAISTRADPGRDTLIVNDTPVDYLDFASPVSELGGKLGLDATCKWPGETHRPWGRIARVDPDLDRHASTICQSLGMKTVQTADRD